MKTVLLVEDSPDDVFFVERAWKKAEISHTLRVAKDGREAIDYLSGKGDFADRKKYPLPILILLDLKLPHFSGLEVLAWMRNAPEFASTRVIMLTSSKEKRDIDEAYRLGAGSYKVKPSDAVELTEFARAVRTYWLTHDSACAG